MEMSGQRHALAALPPGKKPRYPLHRRLGGPQSWFEILEDKNVLFLAGFEPWTLQPVSQSLYRFRLFIYSLNKYKFLFLP